MKISKPFLFFLSITLLPIACSKQGDSVYMPRPATNTSSPYIAQVFDYSPAPGQVINETTGIPEAAQKLVGGHTNIISLGAFGGSVTFGFDHSIPDSTGADIALYGNPSAGWSEPGIVMVSYDANNNGKPDDEWYELAGSHYDSSNTVKNYKVTYYNPHDTADVAWKDNQGNTGTVQLNAFHKHNYYPLFAANQDSLVFTGTLLPNTLGNNSSGWIVNNGFSWGYADSWTTGSDVAGIDNYQQDGYNGFDIAWARDKSGNPAKLTHIDFVKVYTAQLINGGILGEVSTEVSGAADIHLLKK